VIGFEDRQRIIRCRLPLVLPLVLLMVFLAGCFNRSPRASFTLSDDLRPGIEISFINTSTDPNGIEDIAMCSWSFGDGEYADSLNAKHTFRVAGTYTVKLTVYDSEGNADTCERTIDVRSRIFEMPDPDSAVVGKGWDLGGPYGAYIPVTRGYGRSPTEDLWIVDYMYDHRYGAIIPENIVFWLPVGLCEDLNQAVLLRVRWDLMTVTEQSIVSYVDPERYALGSTSRVGGINALWDFWGETEKDSWGRRYELLPAGYYKTRLEIRDEQSGEAFFWDFPFRVCWGGC